MKTEQKREEIYRQCKSDRVIEKLRPSSHIEVHEQDDALVGEDVQRIARAAVDDGQPVDLVVNEHAHPVVEPEMREGVRLNTVSC